MEENQPHLQGSGTRGQARPTHHPQIPKVGPWERGPAHTCHHHEI